MVILFVFTSGVTMVPLPVQDKSQDAAVVFLTATTIAQSPDLFNVAENVGVHDAVLIRFDIMPKSLFRG